MTTTEILQHIRAHMKERGITQVQVAKKMKVEQARVSVILSSKNLDSETLLSLAKAVGLKISLVKPKTPPR